MRILKIYLNNNGKSIVKQQWQEHCLTTLTIALLNHIDKSIV